ncbi:MAG TPA: hypothetical protein VIM12_03645 [Noviherbaspirillum sp.]|jgi:hypothetical protein|uniref:hypothetical protein n=1 Tax=Noviherbaspirillum sp. TaxID=1926288 RepID=UPI002F93012F
MLLPLAALLAACATTLPNSAGNCPTLPQAPAAIEPMPSETYSASTQRDMENWRRRLIGTPATLRP